MRTAKEAYCMNIIIFGTAGGIGKYAVKHALAKGCRVTAYLRDKNKLNISNGKLRIVEGEISDYLPYFP